jgi:hypothetical protein
MVGAMSEEAAQAKRLCDSERWSEAEQALARVQRGDTGDDEGNRQIASYLRAVALYRQGRFSDALSEFALLAARPNHRKHPEAVLWAIKLAGVLPRDASVLRLFATYDARAIERFDNEQQRELFLRGIYLMALDRYGRARLDEAAELLRRLPSSAPDYAAAQQCLQLIEQRS